MYKIFFFLFLFLSVKFSFASTIDEVIVTDSSFLLFKWNPFSKKEIKIKNYIQTDENDSWQKLPKFREDFLPRFITKGPFQNYFVYDLSSNSIVQLDKEFQILTVFPLNKDIVDMHNSSFQFYWVYPNYIYFCSYQKGEVVRFTYSQNRLLFPTRYKIPLFYQGGYLVNYEDKDIFAFYGKKDWFYWSLDFRQLKGVNDVKLEWANTSLPIKLRRLGSWKIKLDSSSVCFEKKRFYICP